MQLNYGDMLPGIIGGKADAGFDNVLTYRAVTRIDFGRGLVQGVGDHDAKLPGLNTGVILFDGDFVASNSIAATVNGEAITPVVYASSHAATLTALAAEIDGLDDVSASVTGAREITVSYTGNGDLTITGVLVTGGASQAVATVTISASSAFIGIALHTHAIAQDCNGDAYYHVNAPVNVCTRGRVWVYAETDLNVGDSVFLRTTAGGANELVGQFRNDDASGDAVSVPVRVTMSGKQGGQAVIEVNLP